MENKNNVSKPKSKPMGKRKFHWFRFFTIILVISVGVEVILGTAAIVMINTMLKDEPKVDLDNFYAQETTLVYDENGNQIADVGAQLRENITYDQIPEALIDAFLAIEDSRYFVHNGFDVPRFTASILNTLLKGDVQGGSTFTMQLVKLTYFTDDTAGTSSTKNIEYKIQQIDLAQQLEKKSTKKQIFEMYLNKMNFGGIGNIRGVEKASEQYFGKKVSELNLPECAMLAGVVNAPYNYNPYTYLDRATDRRDTVLYQMKNHGYITQEDYDLATSVRVEDLLISPVSNSGNTQYQAYIDYALKEAQELTGQDPMNVSMQIYTAMDTAVQQKMEEIEAGNNPNVPFGDDLQEMGAITENNQTGEVIAIGGGRNYVNGGSMLLNHATDQYKQPGSSVKPFLDYGPAFDYLGWATTQTIVDKPVTYGGWTYKNSDDTYHGTVSLQYALTESLNTPAIQTCQALIDKNGMDWYTEYMKKLGFADSVAEGFEIAYAIGGNGFVCTPQQLMAAHAALVNHGQYIKPHAITKIVFRSSSQDPIIPTYQGTTIVSPAAAYMILTLMNGIINSTDYTWMTILKRSYPTYAKTGTTDWGDSGLEYGIPRYAQKDKWMVCDTSQYTTAVWVGWEKAVAGKDTYFTHVKDYMNTTGHIQSELLDTIVEANGVPDAVARPDDVVDFKYIKGIFPYVAPTATTSSSRIVTGLIKKEFATAATTKVTIDPLSNLSDFNAKQNADGTITLTWTPYPDATKLTLTDSSSVSLQMSGPVVYKASITQNGTSVGEFTSSSETSTQTVTLSPGVETKACGYYGYTDATDVSNQVCVTFTSAGQKAQADGNKDYKVVSVAGNVITADDGTTVDLTGIALTKDGAAYDITKLKKDDKITVTYKGGKITAAIVD